MDSGRGLPAILFAPNWNMLPIKGGGVLGLNGGGNIGGPVKLGGALKGPCAPASPLRCGGGVRRPTLLGQGLPTRGNTLGLFLLDPAENGLRPRLGPLPNRLLDSEGLWLRRSGTFLAFLEVSPSSDSSVLSFLCSFLALFALRSSSSSEYSI